MNDLENQISTLTSSQTIELVDSKSISIVHIQVWMQIGDEVRNQIIINVRLKIGDRGNNQTSNYVREQVEEQLNKPKRKFK